MGSAILQIRAKGRQEPISESSKMRLAGRSRFPWTEPKLRSTLSQVNLRVLADAYKPSYFYWESIDMLRKFFIVGVVLVSPGLCGSDRHDATGVKPFSQHTCVAGHTKSIWTIDCEQRRTHVIMIVAVALALRTNLDNEYVQSWPSPQMTPTWCRSTKTTCRRCCGTTRFCWEVLLHVWWLPYVDAHCECER